MAGGPAYGYPGGYAAGGRYPAGGVYAAGGDGCGMAACGCASVGDGVMSYVGGGSGQYIAETTYTYVGWGAGDHDIIPTKKVNYACCLIALGVIIVLLAVLLMLFFMPVTKTTTKTTSDAPIDCDVDLPNLNAVQQALCCEGTGKGCTTQLPTTALPFDCNAGFQNWVKAWSPDKKAWCCTHARRGCAKAPPLPYDCDAGLSNAAAGWSDAKKAWCCQHASKGCAAPQKKCTLWGDPHIIAFDQADADKNKAYSFYGDGDFWIVKSATVYVQGRFEGTEYTEGLAATNRIVVGGPFLHGNKIEVGTRDSGVLTVNGHPVCSAFPSSYKADTFTLTYDDQGNVADVVPEGNEKRIVHIDLPNGVHISVYQWNNYMDVTIEMSVQPGQDGVCGNFNGVFSDDTTQTIMSRVGARVRQGDNFLSGKPVIEFTPQMEKMMDAECPVARQTAGLAACKASLGMPEQDKQVKACTFDECFGMNVNARSHAKTYH